MILHQRFFIQFTTLVMQQAPVIVLLGLCIIGVFYWIWKWKMEILLIVGAWYALHKQSLIQCLTSLLNSCKDHLKQMFLAQMKKVFPALFPTLKRFLSRGMTGLLRGGGMTGLMRGLCNIGEGIRGQFGRAEDDESQEDTDDKTDEDTDDEAGNEMDDEAGNETNKDAIYKPIKRIYMDANILLKMLDPAPDSFDDENFMNEFFSKHVLIRGHLGHLKGYEDLIAFYTAWINSEEAKPFNPKDFKKVWYKTYCDFYTRYCQTHPNFVDTCQNLSIQFKLN